ncbi:MAG: phosphoenolpyruvate synthase, partial [Bacteroidales bacterium]|nr:phosphoenolpyruvate synthase [Bacteroidales bacterium]
MPELPIDLRQISFATTDFSTLMQKRIYRILIVCSNYDFFILEEDGRIEEQIFNEYNALNFRFPPVVLHADTAEEASYLLSTMDIDLIIFLLNPYQSIPISWVSCIKQDYPQIPLVTLVYYSHELTNILNQAAKAYLEPIFCWMGNADLLVAIIKLLEDRFNADHDIQQVGVQAIMIVEDSIKYISIMLPMIYKIVVWQSQELAKEGLNEHQKMLRLRGRPKILLCKTFDEAIQTYEKYSDNLLGIITDVNLKSSFPENREETEGIALCKWVRERDPFLPIILQSTEVGNSTYAKRLKVGFIDKQSKTLPSDYKKYLTTHFAFGDFVFRNPGDGSEYKRVVDLYELQHAILSIPDEIFAFHARRNDFSKWLNARALFSLGKIFKNLRLTDFSNNIPEA